MCYKLNNQSLMNVKIGKKIKICLFNLKYLYLYKKMRTQNLRFYKRYLPKLNCNQILVLKGNKFEDIYNEPIGEHIIVEMCPPEFKEGKTVPYGFLQNYGFKRIKASNEIIITYITKVK